jgi:hypothetical protein
MCLAITLVHLTFQNPLGWERVIELVSLIMTFLELCMTVEEIICCGPQTTWE